MKYFLSLLLILIPVDVHAISKSKGSISKIRPVVKNHNKHLFPLENSINRFKK